MPQLLVILVTPVSLLSLVMTRVANSPVWASEKIHDTPVT
jgi:hypothetical protein